MRVFIIIVILVGVAGCASLYKFDETSGTFLKEKENVPIHKVAEREDRIIKVLETQGKLKVIRVKEQNPVIQWVFGAGLALGGACILLGLAYIWMTKGVKLKEGLLIAGFGITDFALFYALDKYLIWVMIGSALVFVISLVYIFAFKKDVVEKLITSFEQQKEVKFSEGTMKAHVKACQGDKQEAISKLRKKVLKK